MFCTDNAMRDVFICHASEDKANVVHPLKNRLDGSGITYWIDEDEIKWGDNIIGEINYGLSISRYVLVVLSESFLRKKWPQVELNSALTVETSTGNVRILPLIYGDENLIFSRLPLLSGKLFLNWGDGIDRIVEHLNTRLKTNFAGWQSNGPNKIIPSSTITNYDAVIFNEINSIFPLNYCSILRQSSFGDAHTGELLRPFYEFSNKCKNPAFMFQDVLFEAKRNSLKEKSDALLSYVSPYLERVGGDMYRIGPSEGSLGSNIKKMEYWSNIINHACCLVIDFCNELEGLIKEKVKRL